MALLQYFGMNYLMVSMNTVNSPERRNKINLVTEQVILNSLLNTLIHFNLPFVAVVLMLVKIF